jgi:hypothetical protein
MTLPSSITRNGHRTRRSKSSALACIHYSKQRCKHLMVQVSSRRMRILTFQMVFLIFFSFPRTLTFFLSTEATLRRLLWQFTHGVVFEFLAEEISQYPFWAAKVVSVVKKDFRANLNVLTSAFQFFEQTFARGGIRALFEVLFLPILIL